MRSPKLTATLLAVALVTAPLASQAASRSHRAVDACVKAFVARLGAQYGTAPRLKETRYPAGFMPNDGNLQLTLVATNPRARDKAVAAVNCTVSTYGEVIALESQPLSGL